MLVLSLALLLKGQAEVSVRGPRAAHGFQELPSLWICGSILIVVLFIILFILHNFLYVGRA